VFARLGFFLKIFSFDKLNYVGDVDYTNNRYLLLCLEFNATPVYAANVGGHRYGDFKA
jgi:hypothetical protein